MSAGIRARTYPGFAAPELEGPAWGRLLARGPAHVFLTRQWQQAWWECLGSGRLLLVGGERDGEMAALAPLFVAGGMAFFVGSGGSDYLDFVGDTSDPALLDAMLVLARDRIHSDPELAPEGFIGFRFHHLRDDSPTPARLGASAARLGMLCCEEDVQTAPALDLGGEAAGAARPDLERKARKLEREGPLEAIDEQATERILPHLDQLFAQHVERWSATAFPSLFLDPAQRAFYRRLVELGGPAGWLRFTRLVWRGRAIALHLGFRHGPSFLWYKPSYDPALARFSPGALLLAHLLRAARREGASSFDFGLGDEAFKQRYASHSCAVRTYALYPPEVIAGTGRPAASSASASGRDSS